MSSRPLQTLDCQERMFLACLCLTDQDVQDVGAWIDSPDACNSTSTIARARLHQQLGEDPEAAQLVTDRLDLRHFECVSFVRESDIGTLAPLARHACQETAGYTLCGWAWALITDARHEVFALGQRVLSECYARGLRSIAQHPRVAENR